MRIDRSFLGWGVFFILVGTVPLALRAGLLTAAQVDALWTLWPLILVGIGIGLLLRRTPLEWLGGVIVAAVFGVMVGGALAGGIVGFPASACGDSNATSPFPTAVGALGSPTTVSIDHDCGTLEVVTQDGTGYRVEGEDGSGSGPDVTVDDRELSVRPTHGDRGWFGWLGERADWRVVLPRQVDVDLDAIVNAGSSTFDLAAMRIGRASIRLNAGSAVVDLSQVRAIEDFDVQVNAGSVGLLLPGTSSSGSVEVNAGSVKLCGTPGVAIRIRTGGGVAAAYDFGGHGLAQTGSTWESPDYGTAAVRIDLEVQGNAGSFTLDPADGCDG
jgi:hypothetical protein